MPLFRSIALKSYCGVEGKLMETTAIQNIPRKQDSYHTKQKHIKIELGSVIVHTRTTYASRQKQVSEAQWDT